MSNQIEPSLQSNPITASDYGKIDYNNQSNRNKNKSPMQMKMERQRERNQNNDKMFDTNDEDSLGESLLDIIN